VWVDFHCHCLPGMDDGASSVEEAAAMLQRLYSQNVGTVVATPHFCLDNESVESFLKRRRTSYEKLKKHPRAALFPEILMGAEVRVTYEMSKADMRPLAIEGTDVIMLEMPFSAMKNRIIEEIENICGIYKLMPVIAHIERYLEIFSDRDYSKMYSIGNAIFQVNIDAFTHYGTRKTLRHWNNEGLRLLPGSDAHNMSRRPPRFDALNKYAQKQSYRTLMQNFILSTRETGIGM